MTGEPYVKLCRQCSEYHVCIVIEILPVDVNEYSVKAKGLIVVVDKDKVFDENIEFILRRTETIKYSGGKASLYIPGNLMKQTYSVLCRDKSGYTVETLPYDELMVYTGDSMD